MNNELTIYIGDNETKYEIKTPMFFNKLMERLKPIQGVWLFTKNGEHGEIFVTENIETIITAFHYILKDLKREQYRLQHYDTYNEAYDVALEMKSESRFVGRSIIN